MHFSPFIPIALLSLSTFATGILLPRSGADAPGGTHPLQPRIDSVPRVSAILDPRSNYPNIIKGLLFKRQSCLSGYGLCDNGQGCCPLGGECCGYGRSPTIISTPLADENPARLLLHHRNLLLHKYDFLIGLCC